MDYVEIGVSLIFLVLHNDSTISCMRPLCIETDDAWPEIDNSSVILELFLKLKSKIERQALSIHAIFIVLLIIKPFWIQSDIEFLL